MNNKNFLLVYSKSTKFEKLKNFSIITKDAKFAIQTFYGLPKHLYTLNSRKFSITQLSPFKSSKSYIYKSEILDFCFSFCGSYMFIMSADKITVYDDTKQVAIIYGSFTNCRIKSFDGIIAVIGNFNIFIFEHKNNDNKFFQMTKDEDFNFGYKNKYIGRDFMITKYCMLFCKDNVLNIEIIGKIKFSVKFLLPILRTVCKTALNKVYCLCTDNKIYKTFFDGTQNISQINENEVVDIALSYDEKFLVISKKRSLHVYETMNDTFIEEASFEEDINMFECVLDIETVNNLLPIIIKD